MTLNLEPIKENIAKSDSRNEIFCMEKCTTCQFDIVAKNICKLRVKKCYVLRVHTSV